MTFAQPVKEKRYTRDPDLVHLVPFERLSVGSLIARCGFDCSGRSPKPEGTASCVVCIELAKVNAT